MTIRALPYDEQAKVAMRRWVEQWRDAGVRLEERRARDLRGLSESDAARIAVELLWPMSRVGGGDSGEGLVAMHRALCRLAERA